VIEPAAPAPMLDPARLEAFAARLALEPGARVESRCLWAAFAAAFPGRPQGPEERRMMRAALDLLAARGAVRLPRSRRAWDSSLGVEIPSWISVVRDRPPARPPTWRSFAWHPRLAWVIDLSRLSDAEEDLLRKVHDGLVHRRFEHVAPVKYRSLQLLGHEKALENLLGGRLFGTGRLSLDLLGCFTNASPAAWASVGSEPAAIVLENAGQFTVMRNVLAQLPCPPYGIVVFGDGGRFERSIESLTTIGRPIERLHYVGDLDGAGIRIAVGAARTAARSGLPPLRPAPCFHDMMLDSAERLGAPHGWPAPLGRRTTMADSMPRAFLPASVVDRVTLILQKNRRIPEEVLGPDDVMRTLRSQEAS
jgi:hypothetical protein